MNFNGSSLRHSSLMGYIRVDSDVRIRRYDDAIWHSRITSFFEALSAGGAVIACNARFSSSLVPRTKCLLCGVDPKEIYGNDRYYKHVFLETSATYAIPRFQIRCVQTFEESLIHHVRKHCMFLRNWSLFYVFSFSNCVRILYISNIKEIKLKEFKYKIRSIIYTHLQSFYIFFKICLYQNCLFINWFFRNSGLKADLTCGSFRSNAGQSTFSIRAADTRRIRDHACVGVRHRSASGRRERSLGQRVMEKADSMSDEERRRDRTAQRKWAVREMAPNRLVCRWTHYLSHADILDARLIALMASLHVRVSRAIRATEAEGGN